jgi:hypothetical protein
MTLVRAATRLTPPGQATGHVINASVDIDVWVPNHGGYMTFQNMIETTIRLQSGDSGSALFANRNILGTHVAGGSIIHGGQVRSWFSPTVNYRSLVW